MGVYHSDSITASTEPSPRDVTTGKVYPCVINYGLNGGRLPPAAPPSDCFDVTHPTIECDGPFTGHAAMRPSRDAHMNGSGDASEHADLHEMIAMEQEDADEQSGDAAAALPPLVNGLSNGDVTLHNGISANRVPVAGKKRSREDCEELDHKRMRKNGAFSCRLQCGSSCSVLRMK